jgi:hypothetical protein
LRLRLFEGFCRIFFHGGSNKSFVLIRTPFVSTGTAFLRRGDLRVTV